MRGRVHRADRRGGPRDRAALAGGARRRSGDRGRVHLRAGSRAARGAVPEREVRGHRLLAVAGRGDAAEPRGAAVSRARGELRRRRDRGDADAHEDRRVRRRHEDPADPEVRGGVHRRREPRVRGRAGC